MHLRDVIYMKPIYEETYLENCEVSEMQAVYPPHCLL